MASGWPRDSPRTTIQLPAASIANPHPSPLRERTGFCTSCASEPAVVMRMMRRPPIPLPAEPKADRASPGMSAKASPPKANPVKMGGPTTPQNRALPLAGTPMRMAGLPWTSGAGAGELTVISVKSAATRTTASTMNGARIGSPGRKRIQIPPRNAPTARPPTSRATKSVAGLRARSKRSAETILIPTSESATVRDPTLSAAAAPRRSIALCVHR